MLVLFLTTVDEIKTLIHKKGALKQIEVDNATGEVYNWCSSRSTK